MYGNARRCAPQRSYAEAAAVATSGRHRFAVSGVAASVLLERRDNPRDRRRAAFDARIDPRLSAQVSETCAYGVPLPVGDLLTWITYRKANSRFLPSILMRHPSRGAASSLATRPSARRAERHSTSFP